jgi:hypothetical protein
MSERFGEFGQSNESSEFSAEVSLDKKVDGETERKERLTEEFRRINILLREMPKPNEILPEQFVIPSVLEDRENALTGETRSYQKGQVPVYQNGDRKLAYVNESNWSAAVITPADSKIDIYTDRARDCSPLMMHLEKDGKDYTLLSHILYSAPVKQIEHIKEYLIQQKFNIKDVVFSPREDSNDLKNAVNAVDGFASENVNVIQRGRREMACTLATDEGWVLTSGLKKNRKLISSVWEE